MRLTPFRRLPLSLLTMPVVAGLAVATLVSAPPGSTSGAADRTATRLVSRSHPTNAGAVYNWGKAAWDDEFTEPGGHVRGTWHLNRPRRVSLQHGQLTLAAGTRGSVVATATDQSARTGRWEARVRSRQYGHGATPFLVTWELVPRSGDGRWCSSQAIQLASYHPGQREVHGAVHTLPDHLFGYHKRLDLGADVYHTYAVEVTATHISWFVDTRVIRTERRPAALAGVALRPQFRLQHVRGRRMDPSRMQMDWVRYYTMARPDHGSIQAPAMHEGVDHDAPPIAGHRPGRATPAQRQWARAAAATC